MILIADGGSTKCDWLLLNQKGEEIGKTRTEGLNPAVFDTQILKSRLQKDELLVKNKGLIKQVFFYGAGCGTETPIAILQEIFNAFFEQAVNHIFEDTYAAVRAVTDKAGIVCILGTGSNSCFYDGEKVHNPIPSLGYIVMDEASGNYFGKKLLRDYFYKKMPKNIAEDFAKQFNVDADHIKMRIYQQDSPNAYLAHFASFIYQYDIQTPYFKSILEFGMEDFFKKRVLTFDQANEHPIHFIGSIAYFSKEIIENIADKYQVTIGQIIKSPIQNLVAYHQKALIENN